MKYFGLVYSFKIKKMKTFEDLVRKNPSKGIKNLARYEKPGRTIIIPGWVIGQENEFEISLSTLERTTEYNFQDLYDVLILGLINKNQRPKCLLCGKESKFINWTKGYARGCCKKHTEITKRLTEENIKIARIVYPNLPEFQGYHRYCLDKKFNGKIYPLEDIVSTKLPMRFFCNERDLITGEIHGEFVCIFNNLMKSPYGCVECSKTRDVNSKQKLPWKFRFFEDLKKYYPNQLEYLHSNGIKFPKMHDKLHFKCLLCNKEFDASYDLLFSHKVIHNKTIDLIACPDCTKKASVLLRKKWTETSCLEEAKKYKSRGEFEKNCSGAYDVARKNGWLENYIWFQTPEKIYTNPFGDKKAYLIYEYNFSSLGYKSTYVGLTCNLTNRKSGHKCIRMTSSGKIRESSVLKFCESNNIDLEKEESNVLYILENNLTGLEAQQQEEYWRNLREKEGYVIINVAKTGLGSGSLGGAGKKWNLENAFKEIQRAIKEDKRIKSRKDLNKYYNRPTRIVREADKNSIDGISNRLDSVLPQIKPDNYTLETYKRACLEAKEKGICKGGKVWNKLRAAAYGCGGKDEFKNIFNEIFKYFPNSDSIILQFENNTREKLINIFFSTDSLANFLGKTKQAVKEYFTKRGRKDEFIRLKDWLNTDYLQLSNSNRLLSDKLYSQIRKCVNEENTLEIPINPKT